MANRAESPVPWSAQPEEQAEERRPRVDLVEVGSIDGRRMDADEDLASPGHGHVDLVDPNHLGATVSIADGSLHGE